MADKREKNGQMVRSDLRLAMEVKVDEIEEIFYPNN